MLKTKKKLLMILVAVMMLVATACGQSKSSNANNQGSEGSDGNNTPKVKLVFAHGYNEGDFRAKGYKKWAELVHERSNGSIEIEIFPGETLVKFPEGYDAVSTGTVDIFANVSHYMSSAIPELKVLDPPAMYDITKLKELNEAITPLLDEIFQDHNMKYLHTDYQGPSVIVSNTPHPIIKPEDWKGVRWRDGGPYTGQLIKMLGGTSVTIPVGELSTAIHNGVVEAVFQGFAFVKSMGYHEIMKHIVFMPTTKNAHGLITMNLDKWNSLTPEQQQILIDTGKEIFPVYEELGKEAYNEVMELVKNGKAQYHIMTPEEEAVINELTRQTFPALYDELPERGKQLFKIVEQYR